MGGACGPPARRPLATDGRPPAPRQPTLLQPSCLSPLSQGTLLRRLGITRALAASPLASLALLAAVAVVPTPGTIGVAEAGRKVAAYVLSRPAREALFAPIAPEDLYASKLALDALAPRAGDALAAAGVGLLRVAGGATARGVAAAALPACVLAAVAAGRAGRAHLRLVAGGEGK